MTPVLCWLGRSVPFVVVVVIRLLWCLTLCLRGDLAAILGEGGHRRHRAVLGLILDRLAVLGDEVDRRESRGVHLLRDKVALLVAAELVHGQARLGRELVEL